MPLAAGTTLGPYEIVAPIGAGGMGEVYKARDTRLGRTVAIKISHQKFSERFEREARAIASLQHPHICTLYDVGPDYLVMEYIEGEPLQGPLPIDKALEYAKQILDALHTAHKTGIAHRDLKPANILVTRQGIKLLDFGLAKATQKEHVPDATVTIALTSEGQIVGTLPYMAPEQLHGKETDERVDIWAFGLVLYEMLTGKRAFEAESQATLIAEILKSEPSLITEFAPQAPAALDRVMRICLAKDREDRWQSARDVRLALENMPSAEITQAPARNKPGWFWPAAALLLASTAVPWVLYLRREPPPQAAPIRFQISPPEGNQLFLTGSRTAILSPDGRRLAFVATSAKDGFRRIWIRPLDASEAYPLPGTEGGMGLFWAPDSRELGFFAENKLKKVDASGGVPQPLCDHASGESAGSWAPGGTILVGNIGGGLMRVPSSGGVPAPVTRLDESRGESAHRSPAFLPDGNHFLYRTEAKAEQVGIYVAALDGAPPKRIPIQSLDSQGLTASVAPTFRFGGGHILFQRGESMMAQRFNVQRLELQGEPFLVAPVASVLSASVSENGMLAFTGIGGTGEELLMVDRHGARLASLGPSDGGVYFHFEVSPDDKRLAVDRRYLGASRASDLWSIDIARGVSTRLTFDTASQVPVWSIDGSKIFFSQGNHIAQMPASGAGRPETVAEVLAHHMHASLDGKFLAFGREGGLAARKIWILPLDGQGKASPLLNGPAGEGGPRFSPDGRWFAYDSLESGRREVYVQSFPPGTGKWQVSRTGGWEPRWRRDGKEIYYREQGLRIMAADVAIRSGALETGIPHALFDPRIPDTAEPRRFAVTSDGQRFFYSAPIGDQSPRAITVVQNWLSAVKR